MPSNRSKAARAKGGAASVFDRLDALARNLWWTWNPDAQRLFAALDPALWEYSHRNPLKTMAWMSPERRAAVEVDEAFAALLGQVEGQLKAYLGARTWFDRTARGAASHVQAAYFCAEFAIHESLPMYAGGLGVLAGDHLKSASDLGIPLVAVGLLYRNGYYRQELLTDGQTHVVYPKHDYDYLPIHDSGTLIRCPMGGREIAARIWVAQVGRVPLYLLDADIPENRPADRGITQRLYGGDQTTRIQQEILLGVGGVRALSAMKLDINVYHLNEGHAAFCALERLRQLRASGVTMPKAVERVRATTVFTTHTPVPAGHDRFPPAAMKKFLGPMMTQLGVTPDEWLGFGRENAADSKEPFCMTVLALRLSSRCNGVSKLHGEVSRAMWTKVFDASDPADVPIGSITNGIHAETWLAPEIRPLYDKYLKPRWVGAGPGDDWWQRADRIPPAELWHVRNLLRRKLVQFVRRRLVQQVQRRCEPVSELMAALETFDENVLTIGFARRFATYKRAPLVFAQAKRLAAILNNPKMPVQIVFAGKAHPADKDGQGFAQKVYQMARQAGFRGRVVLIEDYDMNVGRMLTSGCDVWLNNPLKPQEASGTSGMKPPLHGGLNFSVLDGWWPEAFNGRNGWSIGNGPAKTREAQDRKDAESIYQTLENELVPLFYKRDSSGVPAGWVKRMIESMKTVCGVFNTHRMLAEYLEMYAGEAK